MSRPTGTERVTMLQLFIRKVPFNRTLKYVNKQLVLYSDPVRQH